MRGAESARERRGRSDLTTLALEVLLVGAAYYVAARLGLRLALIEKNVTPLWPPSGIAVVAFLLLGRRVWPGVALAAFLVNVTITPSLLAAAATAAGNTLAPMVAAQLLFAMGFRKELDRLRDALAIVVAALFSMLISATIGAGTLVLSDAIPRTKFASAWAVWWTGDAMGVLVVAPFLLSLLLVRRREPTSWPRRVEAAGLFVALAIATLAVFRSHHGLLFLTIPFVGWAAWRFQQRGAAPAALLVAGIATWAADHGWGPFAGGGTLFSTMLTLQAYNATIALTSFFFAAVVTERMRDRDALERSAIELEERVRRRTAELRKREGQLAEAQQVARVGSWEWLIEEDRVTWSDEMYRIHGHRPQQFPLSFEKAVEQVVPGDLESITANVAAALAKGRDHDVIGNEYRILRADGSERTLQGKARLHFSSEGVPLRMVGTVQDVTDDKPAEREHRIAETLQRSLLPELLPDIPGIVLAARYVPATREAEVGGDWYDVVPLPDGRLGVAIGDVAGHGLRAASTMGQLRMALRAYAVESESPGEVLARMQQLVRALGLPDMATAVYLVFDPDSGLVVYSNAGHPPPLVITPEGEASFLEEGLAPPLGTMPHAEHVEATSRLVPGSTLLLFTDGLIERRGSSLREGLERLRLAAAGGAVTDLEELCDLVLASLVERDVDDDIALLALQPVLLAGRPLHLRVPAEPRSLAPLRHTLRRWLREVDAGRQESYEILVACGEACANAIQHPFAARQDILEIDLALRDQDVELVVRDTGTWRSASSGGGGHGLALIRQLMDSVQIQSGPGGTEVQMRRRLRRENADERARAR
jgi:PAS domain S-box-containing protein